MSLIQVVKHFQSNGRIAARRAQPESHFGVMFSQGANYSSCISLYGTCVSR